MKEKDLIKGIDKLNETFKTNDDNLVLNDYERQRLFKLAYDMQMKINNLQTRIDKAIEILKDTSVDMPETLLIETIDYARHILNGDE